MDDAIEQAVLGFAIDNLAAERVRYRTNCGTKHVCQPDGRSFRMARWMCAKSGVATFGAAWLFGYSRVSSCSSSNSCTSGHAMPASAARRKHSVGVDRAIDRLAAIL